MRTTLSEIGHQKPPTPVATDNTSANSMFNGMAKQKRTRAIDMRIYWVRDRIQKNHFHIFWEEGKKNPAEFVFIFFLGMRSSGVTLAPVPPETI